MRPSFVPPGNVEAQGHLGPSVLRRTASMLDVQAGLPSYRPPLASVGRAHPTADDLWTRLRHLASSERTRSWLGLGAGVVVQIVALALIFGAV